MYVCKKRIRMYVCNWIKWLIYEMLEMEIIWFICIVNLDVYEIMMVSVWKLYGKMYVSS